ncbi:MAG: chromosome segregation protein SMC [Acidobacteria bacterium]|nr:MAG: chromosome segregation protein SMC [Acidobacteria bacterium 13_2_20CM_58_27]PYT84315.1 MAG: chromosome segregation protein SMC [Acidobacteriota bacterium]
MLKLRKVEIVGFKSFCERTVVTFSGSGTTCIVGPNGCGKSNVVDAISWVLGEQSHKSLRAERMADCIFNGTTKRPPLGMAEVTITMEDPELADAARFVMEGAAAEEKKDSAAEGGENTAKDQFDGDSATGALESEPRSQDAAGPAPALESTEESGGRLKKLFKRKKRNEEKPTLATKPGEIMVSRRLYRSGQSEYLINGRVARLRDVQEMFMGVGLGPDSYAIIEQGRIGLILSTKPMERRAIIEEAAGVTKFKTKKRLAEAKLESSKLNLARVNDIVIEVEKQLGSLKRQAAKARRYSEIRDQMRGIVRQMLAGKARELDAAAERIGKQLEELSAVETERAAAIQQMEGEQDRLNQRIYELDAELRQNQNVLNLTALEADRSENRIAFNRQRAQELAGRHAQMDAELKQARAQAAEWEMRSATQVQAVTLLREESGALNGRVEELLQRVEQRAVEIRDAEGGIEALRQRASEAGESLLRLHGEQKQAEEALVHQTEAVRKLETNEHEMLETSMRARDDADRVAHELEAVTEQLGALKQNAAELQAKIGGLREQRDGLTKEADALRDALASVRARHSTLTQILNDRSYTAEAVQKLFAANERGGGQQFRAVGVLADYAEVEEGHEAAIEQFLRDELEFVVVETFDHARTGISMLRDEVGGRATFFVDSLRNLRLENEYEPIANFHREDGVISRMDKLVEFRNPLGAAAKQFLPRLRAAYLTDSAAAAEKLARENPQYAFVTPDGTCYQGRMVTGGRPGEAGPLGMKRELRALNAELLRLEHRMNEKQAALAAAAAELRATEQALEQISATQRDVEREAISVQHRHSHMQTELARLGAELAVCQGELARVRKEAEGARQRTERAKHDHAAAALDRAGAETESTRLADRLVGLRGSVQSEQHELATARAGLAAINERLAAAEALATRLREERTEMERRETTLQQQVLSLGDETAGLAKQSEELTQQLDGLRAEKLRLEVRQKELEQEWESARTRVTETEDHLRMARQQLQELREQRNHSEVERAKNESDRGHLRESCMSEVNAQPEDLIATETAFMSGEELAAAEANYREMKQRVENMGAVNMMALEEFNECEQRFTFLTRERDDLLKSMADTQQAIVELDQATKEKFEHAFHAINKSFSDAFHAIFGGGMAEMRLTEPDSSGDAGIDIVASPPGKRLQNVLLLSGGEKAMTALALLIAIFRYQPSPFCILDEVDAPLDEANVGRFTKLIGEMSSQTQFIVVTHNRKTMEIAPVLYGVTMQEPGVSKLVSVRWEETGNENAGAKATAVSAA